MGLGFVQGQVGSRVTDSILSKIGIDDMSLLAQKVTQVTVGTLVDTTMDWFMSELTGQEFDLKESLAMNAFENGFSEAISDPVDAVTGAYLLHETDFILASLPEAIKLERNYLSTRKSISVLGKGWHFVYDSRIYVNTKKTPKGETTVYEYDKVGRRMSINNSYGTVELSYNSRNFVTKRVDGEGYVSYWFCCDSKKERT